MVEVVKYSEKYKAEWDAFVRKSKNGTFLFCRDYMEYHADRFQDHSLLLYYKQKLLALLPANVQAKTVYSHGGLSYGGFVTDARMKAGIMLEVLDAVIAYFRQLGYKSIKYKAIPHIYHQLPADEDLYALFRVGAKLYRRDLNSVVDLSCKLPYAALRKRKLKLAPELTLQQSTNYLEAMQLGQNLLQEKYKASPVHSGAELQLLASHFPVNIKLFTASQGVATEAAVVVYETPAVAHAQYIFSTANGREIGALDVLTNWLLTEVYAAKAYFSFGVSTEREGSYLNAGLIQNKESYGARAVAHDFYEVEL